MLIPLLGDLHFGVKNDARFMLEYQLSFFEKQFIPYLISNNIKKFIQFGDIFDRRKYSNHETLYLIRERIFKKLEELGIEMITGTGNHDVYFKNTNKINSLDLFLRDYSNITQIHEPTEYELDGVKFLHVPWICDDNETLVLKSIKDSTADYLIGHFDIVGHEMYAGVLSTHGLDRKLFKKFKQVWSGHYHHKSLEKNIRYIGTPYEMTWSDADDPKGFYVFDTENHSIVFVENPERLHEKIIYNDSDVAKKQYIQNIDYSKFDKKIVKVIVEKKSDTDFFDKFTEKLYNQNIIDLSINEDMSEFYQENVEVSENLTTGQLINEYIENVDTASDKQRLKKIMHNLHVEALLGAE